MRTKKDNLKKALGGLSMLVLGQHLWEINTVANGAIACLCDCCTEARIAYRMATGDWPTPEQEHEAMKAWSLRRNH